VASGGKPSAKSEDQYLDEAVALNNKQRKEMKIDEAPIDESHAKTQAN
jgi:hypothetical protein